MRKNTKPRKKNANKVSRDRKLAQIFTKNLAVTFLPGEKCNIIDMTTLKKCDGLSSRRLYDITQHQHKWTIMLIVFGRTETGDEYFKCEEAVSPRPCYQHEIGDSMNQVHRRLYDNFNKNHFISLGWIACMHDREFDLDEMMKLFTELGAFEYITKHEDVSFDSPVK
jgi:hypothetical protein